MGQQLALFNLELFEDTTFTSENEETKRLSTLFDISKYERAPSDSLGAYELERAAEILLGFSFSRKKIVGISLDFFEDLLKKEDVLNYDGDCVGSNDVPTLECFFDRGFINGNYEVGFIQPTYKLLENQEVPKKA